MSISVALGKHAVLMSRPSKGSHEQTFLMSELESLGLSSIKLNEFNDNFELRRLVNAIKEDFFSQYRREIRL